VLIRQKSKEKLKRLKSFVAGVKPAFFLGGVGLTQLLDGL